MDVGRCGASLPGACWFPPCPLRTGLRGTSHPVIPGAREDGKNRDNGNRFSCLLRMAWHEKIWHGLKSVGRSLLGHEACKLPGPILQFHLVLLHLQLHLLPCGLEQLLTEPHARDRLPWPVTHILRPRSSWAFSRFRFSTWPVWGEADECSSSIGMRVLLNGYPPGLCSIFG